jgi:hypothetical protein
VGAIPNLFFTLFISIIMLKFQEIKYTKKGQFVTFRGRRHYLDTFMRFDSLCKYYKAKHNDKPYITANGYKQVSNSHALLIEFSDCGNAAKLFLS